MPKQSSLCEKGDDSRCCPGQHKQRFTFYGIRRRRPRLRGRVAPPLRRVKGAHETPHKPPLRSGWWRSSWTPLTRLRSGAALQGAKPTTTRGVAIRRCPQGRDVEGRVPGTEEDMQQLMTEEIAKTVPRLYGQDGADGPIVQLTARRPSRRAFLLFRDRVLGPILGLSNKISICNI